MSLGERLRQLEQENKILQLDLRICLDELGNPARSTAAQARVCSHYPAHISSPYLPVESQSEDKTLHRQPSFKWVQYVNKPTRSPTRVNLEADIESPKVSPLAQEHDIATV